MADENTCEVCGLRMHRFGFPEDYLVDGVLSHQPTAVACANSIIGLLDEMVLIGVTPRRRDWLRETIDNAITDLAFHIDSLDDRTQDYRAPVSERESVG